MSSVPLSLAIIRDFRRAATMASSSQATRRPEIDVSTTSAQAFAVQSSTMTSPRERRPSASTSETNSRLQR
jgi:hypothetical protein